MGSTYTRFGAYGADQKHPNASKSVNRASKPKQQIVVATLTPPLASHALFHPSASKPFGPNGGSAPLSGVTQAVL
jgi:hypothetical protein